MAKAKVKRNWPVSDDARVVISMAMEQKARADAEFNQALAVARRLSDVPESVEAGNLTLDTDEWIEKA